MCSYDSPSWPPDPVIRVGYQGLFLSTWHSANQTKSISYWRPLPHSEDERWEKGLAVQESWLSSRVPSHTRRVSSRVSSHCFFQGQSPESSPESSVSNSSLCESSPKFLESLGYSAVGRVIEVVKGISNNLEWSLYRLMLWFLLILGWLSSTFCNAMLSVRIRR